jgi:hypothetical protein
MIHLIVAAAVALAVFTALMCFCPPFNRWVARRAGAREGMSFSAYMWQTEQFGWWLAELLRPMVGGLFWVIRRQKDHCKSAWLQETQAGE